MKLWASKLTGLVGLTATLTCATEVVASDIPKPPPQSAPQILGGARLYQQQCASCHGAQGQGARSFPRPIWGPASNIGKFGTAQGLFEYVQLMMPFDNPSKLKDGDKTAIVAYMLVRNGTLKPPVTLPLGGNQVAIK